MNLSFIGTMDRSTVINSQGIRSKLDIDERIGILHNNLKADRKAFEETKDKLGLIARAQYELDIMLAEKELLSLMIERLKY
jgi:hypothetical protein